MTRTYAGTVLVTVLIHLALMDVGDPTAKLEIVIVVIIVRRQLGGVYFGMISIQKIGESPQWMTVLSAIINAICRCYVS